MTRLARTQRGAVCAPVIMALSLIPACAAPGIQGSAITPQSNAAPTFMPANPGGAAGVNTVPTPPTTVSIPKFGLDEQLIELGLEADGTMQVPTNADDVGWFTGSGTPGNHGPTVLAGHVDSADGPGVFFNLRDLSTGDEIVLTTAEAHTVTYVVTHAADYPKNEFPTTAVFGATAQDELRLITCTGLFDRNASSYTENRVVFARAVSPLQ